MEKRIVFLLAALAAPCAAADEKPAPRVYTNEDLARVAPFRGETGVLSRPAAAANAAPRDREARRPPGKGQDYWQREADKVRERVRPLQKRAASLRRQIDERWRLPGVAPTTDPKLIDWRRELRETEVEIRELEDRLEERARRDGALPGWLR
jgi:hypothetical protein